MALFVNSDGAVDLDLPTVADGSPLTADDLATHLFHLLDACGQHPLMSRPGRQDARLGAEVILEAYGIGPIDTRREYVRATIATLRLIDAGHGTEALAALTDIAGAHAVPIDDLTDTPHQHP